MKKIAFAVSLLISLSSFAQWGPWKKIEGNGNIKKETRQVKAGYTSISSSGSWDVMVAYGESNSIEVEGDENLLEYIDTKIEGDNLNIRSKGNVSLNSRHKITVYVSLTRITGMHLSGSGDMIGEGRFSNTGSAEFRASGSGSIKLDADKLGEVSVKISGSGHIRLSGSAKSVEVGISGSGSADCSKLIADDASMHISGSGSAKVNANRSVDASISGSGNATYTGAATEVRKHISGSGWFGKAK